MDPPLNSDVSRPTSCGTLASIVDEAQRSPGLKSSLVHSRELDGLRGCAALMVFVLHVVRATTGKVAPEALPPGWSLLDRIAYLGTFGVDVFFVLSGFLITSLLLADKDEPAFFHNFYWKRVLRIQPVYLLHLVIALLISGSWGYVLMCLLFVVNFAARFGVPPVGPAWTLAIEEQFYLLWPQVVRRLSLVAICWASIWVLLGSLAFREGMLTVLHHADLRFTWYRFDGLAMGALMACQWMAIGDVWTPSLRRFLRLFNHPVLLVIALAYLACFFAAVQGTNFALALFCVNYLVYRIIGYVMANPRSRAFGWLGWSPLVFMGAISYSFYMLHPFVMGLVDVSMHPPGLYPVKFLSYCAVVTAASVGVSMAVRYLIELPALRLRRFVLR